MKHSIRMFALLVGMLLTGFTVPTIASATGLAWNVTNVDGAIGIGSISCPTESLCAAVSPQGVITSTNPTGGAGAWTVTNVGSEYLSDISCPTVSLCVAVDRNRHVVTSTNPTGGAGAWTVFSVNGPTEFLLSVSCPTVSLCVAVDLHGDVLTSTNPTGGESAWTATKVDGDNPIYDISCPTVSLCVAVDWHGDTVTSTNPTGGAGAWNVTDVYDYVLEAISCPSVSLCVVVSGDVVSTSTNPTGGAGAWTAFSVNGPKYLHDVSCSSASQCAAVWGDVVVTSTNPTGGESAWTATHMEGAESLYGISCPTESLCVASDALEGNTLEGNIVVGTPAVLPVNTSPPTVSGTAQVGKFLYCTPGNWSGSLPRTYTYQWQRDGAAIGGAIYYYYSVSDADQGHTLTCAVTAHNAAGASIPAASAPTGVVQAKPASKSTAPSPVVVPAMAKCTVPKLKGKTLIQATRLLTRRNCKLGKVSRPKTQSKHKAVVVSQKPKAGKVLPAKSKIAVKLS
jgi:hypothetical protein